MQTQIQLAGQPATLTADNPAKIRMQAAGGRISQLLDIDHGYLHALHLVIAMLDADSRAKYPTPEVLAEIIPDQGEAFEAVVGAAFQLANSAGWFVTAEQLQN